MIPDEPRPADRGMLSIGSPYSFADTLQRLLSAFEEHDIKVFAVVDQLDVRYSHVGWDGHVHRLFRHPVLHLVTVLVIRIVLLDLRLCTACSCVSTERQQNSHR